MKNTTKYSYWFVRFFCRQNIYAYMKHDPDFFFMHACISPTVLIRIFHKRKALLRITEVVLLSQRNNIVLAVDTHTHIYHRGHETLFHEPSKQILHPASVTHSHASAVPADPTWIILSPANQLCLVGSL